MSRAIILIALFSCLAINFVTADHGKAAIALQRTFLQFMIDSRDLTQRNPQQSMACFDYYTPLLTEITKEYERSYALCLDGADEKRSGIDAATQPERDLIESSAISACSALDLCTQESDSIGYFGCFADIGADNTKVMYEISANSSDILAEVRERYRLIDVDMYKCTNASERVYVEDTTSTYEELQNCLRGLSPVPTTTAAPPSTEPATTTPEATTAEEDTTTADPSETQDDDEKQILAIKDTRVHHRMLKKLRNVAA